MAGLHLTHWYPTAGEDWGWWDWDEASNEPYTSDGLYDWGNPFLNGEAEWWPSDWDDEDETEFWAALEDALHPDHDQDEEEEWGPDEQV